MPATPLWGGLLALLYIALTVRVVRNRQRARVAIGHGRDASLERAIRSHANFAEYVPIALVLMLAAELLGAWVWLAHLAGAMLLAGRLVHAYGIVREANDLRLRPFGMGLTLTSIAILAITNLALAFLRP